MRYSFLLLMFWDLVSGVPLKESSTETAYPFLRPLKPPASVNDNNAPNFPDTSESRQTYFDQQSNQVQGPQFSGQDYPPPVQEFRPQSPLIPPGPSIQHQQQDTSPAQTPLYSVQEVSPPEFTHQSPILPPDRFVQQQEQQADNGDTQPTYGAAAQCGDGTPVGPDQQCVGANSASNTIDYSVYAGLDLNPSADPVSQSIDSTRIPTVAQPASVPTGTYYNTDPGQSEPPREPVPSDSRPVPRPLQTVLVGHNEVEIPQFTDRYLTADGSEVFVTDGARIGLAITTATRSYPRPDTNSALQTVVLNGELYPTRAFVYISDPSRMPIVASTGGCVTKIDVTGGNVEGSNPTFVPSPAFVEFAASIQKLCNQEIAFGQTVGGPSSSAFPGVFQQQQQQFFPPHPALQFYSGETNHISATQPNELHPPFFQQHSAVEYGPAPQYENAPAAGRDPVRTFQEFQPFSHQQPSFDRYQEQHSFSGGDALPESNGGPFRSQSDSGGFGQQPFEAQYGFNQLQQSQPSFSQQPQTENFQSQGSERFDHGNQFGSNIFQQQQTSHFFDPQINQQYLNDQRLQGNFNAFNQPFQPGNQIQQSFDPQFNQVNTIENAQGFNERFPQGDRKEFGQFFQGHSQEFNRPIQNARPTQFNPQFQQGNSPSFNSQEFNRHETESGEPFRGFNNDPFQQNNQQLPPSSAPDTTDQDHESGSQGAGHTPTFIQRFPQVYLPPKSPFPPVIPPRIIAPHSAFYKHDLPKCGLPNKKLLQISSVVFGKESAKISTGFTASSIEAKYGQNPWHAAILVRANSYRDGPILPGGLQYVCGGSLVSPNIVITAAHCVSDINKHKLLVRFGDHDLRTSLYELHKPVDVTVIKVFIHPDYSPSSYASDLALLQLKSPLPLRLLPHVGIICLPDGRSTGLPCRVTGWGHDAYQERPDVRLPLKSVSVTPISPLACTNRLRSTVLGPQFSLHNSSLCAVGEHGQSTCLGDGGGGLVCPSVGDEDGDKQFVLVGVTSWGIECDNDSPGVYTDVAAHSDWLNSVLGIEPDYPSPEYRPSPNPARFF